MGSINDVMSEVDFMVHLWPADTVRPTCTSPVFSGSPLYGYVGYRLNFKVEGRFTSGFGGVGISVGYRSRMSEKGVTIVGEENSIRVTMTQYDNTTVAHVSYLVPDWVEGWIGLCFAAYKKSNPRIQSDLKCVDLVLLKNEVTQVYTMADKEFVQMSHDGVAVPNSYTMREGQVLPLIVRAFKPPKDDFINLTISGDTNFDNVLDLEEAGKYYNKSLQTPWNASLQIVEAGHNASFLVTYTPPRGYTGTNLRLCLKARGAEGRYRVVEDTELCVSIEVQRCVWTVQESENLVSIAQSIGVSWLQVWNYNKEDLSRPDLDLAKGQAVRVGQLYQVSKGDTLASIAGRFSTSLDMLMRMNVDLEGSAHIQPDQIVCITFNSCASDLVA